MKQKKILKRMLSIVLAAVLIAPTAWIPAENNAAVSTAASSEVVYVSADDGDDSYAGTAEAPVKTLGKAFEVVANGGTVQIVGSYDGATSWSATGKAITITGETLNFVTGNITLGGLGDTLTFKNITLGLAAAQRVFANGCKLTIGEGVVTTNEADLYGGCDTGTLNGDTYLEVYSGNWRKIFGGGNDRPTTLNGSTHVVVGGNVNEGLDVSDHDLPNVFYGGGNGDTITGSTNITVTGSARAIHVYGGGAWSQHGEPSVGAGTNVVVTDSAQVMSVWGGSNFGGSIDCTAQLNTNVLMTGGTVEQIFGGNNKANLTGNVDVKVLGGTVTRRIYGGNYNEYLGGTNYSVTGNIDLTIGGDANITFTGSDDQGIFARSRINPKSDSEIATIIFDDEKAYTTYKEQIGAYDSGAELVMGDVTAADSIHYYTYTADDVANTITATCNICETSHSATATLSVVGEGPFGYTGKAIECAKVEYSAWELAPLEIDYQNNVEEGTATATCTKNGVSVSVNFEIKSTVLSGKKISILGDSISTYEGVSNNASFNTTIGLNNRYYETGAGKALPTQNLTYWGQLIEKYGMELCVNNSTGGGKVATDVEKNDGCQRLSGIKRSTELHNNAGQEPDIIVVYLGTNDLADNDSVTFRSAYKEMIDNILARYENAELFCFTLLPGREYQTYETRVDAYNNQIKKVVKGYKDRVTLVDMYTESGIAWNNLSLYTCDYNATTKYGLHPNSTGMELIAKVLERALLDAYEPASLPNTPNPYFDLEIDLKNDMAQNAGTSNATIKKEGKGSYTTKEVVYNGQTCSVPVFSVEKDTSDTSNSYLDVTFNDLESSSTAMENWIFNDNGGITFECFLYVDAQPTAWSGIMSNMNAGGISLHAVPTNTGNSNFFIGINDGQGSSQTGNWKTTYNGVDNYRYKGNYSTAGYYENIKANSLDTGTFVHVVGTYDKNTNMMSLYHDGELIDSGSYGAGPFKSGSITDFNRLGIGTDISYTKESLDDTTSYAIADARVYSGSLTAAQVKQEYENRWNEVLETATGPEVYFDLDFQEGTAVSVGTNKANTTIEQVEGDITTMDVLHNGNICKVPVYSVDKSNTKSYLGVTFEDIAKATTTTPAQAMSDWIFDNGITYECFIYVDEVPTGTAGFMTNLNGGGIGLYSKQAGLNFQIGSNDTKSGTHPFNDKYICAFPYSTSPEIQDKVVKNLQAAQNYQLLNEGKLTHVVGTYDAKTNVMSVYKDGQLIGQGTYSTGGEADYRPGSSLPGQIGLGCNIAYSGEWMNQYTGYKIADARVYSSALTAEQVAAEYNNRWNEVSECAETTGLGDLTDYPEVTEGARDVQDGLPTYYSGGDTYGIYEGSNSGDRAAGGDGDYTLHAFSNSTPEAYVSYLKALEADGWIQYSNRIEGNNLFATYTKDMDGDDELESVYAYYIASKAYTYIVVSNTANLENKAEAYEEVCEPLFTELKNKSSSQCEILRLSDGRFIIIDSGMLETDHYQAKNIYKTLKEQNVLNKITIAAWIVTHAHTDHMDACADFLKVYGNDQVEVEEIIFNFPNKADREEADSTNQPYTTPVFFDALAIAQKKWPNMKIITCHTGQEYQIADATIEILHTQEDYFPTKIKDVKDGLNDSSVAFRIKIAGQTIMILGDAGTGVSNGMITMWGDYLKSDFVQMAHHGMNGGIVPVYERIDPTVVTIPATRALWTTSDANYIGQYNPTKWALDNISGNIKEICIAGLGTHTFTLPYTPQGDNAAIIGAEQNGYDLEEGPKVKVDDMPEPYMDLTFDGTGITDGSTKANNTLEMVGGSVGEQTVYYKGEPYKVTAYRGEKTSSDYNYIKLTMDGISPTDDTGITELLTGGNGHALEAFYALDTEPSRVGGVMSGCNTGGVTIYARKDGIVGYQLGSENANGGNTYVYAADTESTKAKNNYTMPLGKTVVHVVATYDEVNHKLNLYRNGVLMSSADYSAKFKAAASTAMAYNVLGIGANVGALHEAIGRETGYTIIKSRIYDESLNAEQVAASYWNCITELTKSEGQDIAERETEIYEQQTVEYTREDANKFLANKTYPRKDGYLFGGWYTTTDIPEIDVNNYDESVEAALKKVIKTEIPENVDKVYALFVPEDVMTVKAQISGNLLDNDDSNNGTGAIRFVTTVDSLLYKEVGFTVSYMNSSGTPTAVTKASKKVYEKLHAVDATTGAGIEAEEWDYFPTQFCSVSKYFKACHVYNLSAEKFGREYTVTPYWVTMDGSYVYGEPVVKSISQYPSMLK